MFTPFGYDPFFGFGSRRGTGSNNNRRLRGFLPIWEPFDEFMNDPFFSSTSIDYDNGAQEVEQKNDQKMIKGSEADNKPASEEKQLTSNNTARNKDTGLSLWSPSWNSLTLNEKIDFQVEESKDKYTVNAKLNGFNKEHLKLQVKDGLLTVSGEIKEEKKDKNSYSKSTRYVSRSMALPENINEEKISAKYENGVLAVSIPKLEKPKEEKKDTIMIE